MKHVRIYGRQAKDRKLRMDARNYLADCMKVGAGVIGSHLVMGLMIMIMDAL